MGKQSAGFGKYNTYSRFAWFTCACAWPPERARFPMNLKVLSACPLRISRTPCSRSWPSREGTSASRGCTPHTCSFPCRGGSRCTPCSAVSACRAGTGCPHGKRKRRGAHHAVVFLRLPVRARLASTSFPSSSSSSSSSLNGGGGTLQRGFGTSPRTSRACVEGVPRTSFASKVVAF